MEILRLELMTPDLQAARHFYSETLGLGASSESEDRSSVRAGTTELVFRQAEPGWQGAYHFAFNIPENRFEESREWVTYGWIGPLSGTKRRVYGGGR